MCVDDRSRTPLGGHRVAAHRVDLGDNRDVELRVRLGCSDGSAEPCPSASHNEYVMHECPASSFIMPACPELNRRTRIAYAPLRTGNLARRLYALCANTLSIAATNSCTRLTDTAISCFSLSLRAISITRSTPPAPISTGTPK